MKSFYIFIGIILIRIMVKVEDREREIADEASQRQKCKRNLNEI